MFKNSFVFSFAVVAVIAGIGKLIPLLGEDGEGILFLFPYADWFSQVSIFTVILTVTSYLSLMILCMISSNFINEEQANGYFKNIAGQVKDKSMLILSKFFTVFVISLAVLVCYVAGSALASVILMGNSLTFDYPDGFAFAMCTRFVLYLAVNAIIIFLCTLTKSKSLAIVFGLVFGTGVTRFDYSILVTFLGMVLKTDIYIASFTPDGQVFSISAESTNGDLVKAFAVGVCYIVAFLLFSSLILKKRDNK
ncbi:MAG: ABC transporter permease [Clostridia bacterium]|nr:ABC transporter permease [Clostridia bacterium]